MSSPIVPVGVGAAGKVTSGVVLLLIAPVRTPFFGEASYLTTVVGCTAAGAERSDMITSRGRRASKFVVPFITNCQPSVLRAWIAMPLFGAPLRRRSA